MEKINKEQEEEISKRIIISTQLSYEKGLS